MNNKQILNRTVDENPELVREFAETMRRKAMAHGYDPEKRIIVQLLVPFPDEDSRALPDD